MPFDPLHIKGEGLAAARSGRPIVAGVGFTLAPGGALLVEGANGAGKTTLLRMVAGLLAPESGHLLEAARADGPWEPARLGVRVHYLGHRDAVKPGLTASENLGFWGRFSGQRTPDAKAIASALDAVGLRHKTNEPARALSAGQRRRLALARLVLAPQPLWILDEPATALDRGSERILETLFASHRAAGGLLMVASHGALPIASSGAQRLTLVPQASEAG